MIIGEGVSGLSHRLAPRARYQTDHDALPNKNAAGSSLPTAFELIEYTTSPA
jgi:hypothetical protein